MTTSVAVFRKHFAKSKVEIKMNKEKTDDEKWNQYKETISRKYAKDFKFEAKALKWEILLIAHTQKNANTKEAKKKNNKQWEQKHQNKAAITMKRWLKRNQNKRQPNDGRKLEIEPP